MLDVICVKDEFDYGIFAQSFAGLSEIKRIILYNPEHVGQELVHSLFIALSRRQQQVACTALQQQLTISGFSLQKICALLARPY
jgi:hypothetical protein